MCRRPSCASLQLLSWAHWTLPLQTNIFEMLSMLLKGLSLIKHGVDSNFFVILSLSEIHSFANLWLYVLIFGVKWVDYTATSGTLVNLIKPGSMQHKILRKVKWIMFSSLLGQDLRTRRSWAGHGTIGNYTVSKTCGQTARPCACDEALEDLPKELSLKDLTCSCTKQKPPNDKESCFRLDLHCTLMTLLCQCRRGVDWITSFCAYLACHHSVLSSLWKALDTPCKD